MAAPAVQAALQDLYNQHGRLDPRDVVNVARDPENPLHDRFEWDDTVAAESYRLEQARMLIRSVKVTVQPSKSEPARTIRMFVHDTVNDGYLAVQDIAAQPKVRDQILDDMRADLERLKKKWDLYADTFAVLAAEILAAEIQEEPAKAPTKRAVRTR